MTNEPKDNPDKVVSETMTKPCYIKRLEKRKKERHEKLLAEQEEAEAKKREQELSK